MDSILNKKNFDRIYRIDWIFFRLSGRKPENPIAFGEDEISYSQLFAKLSTHHFV
jgi:hypothetical protein